jgi:hypothetical protein
MQQRRGAGSSFTVKQQRMSTTKQDMYLFDCGNPAVLEGKQHGVDSSMKMHSSRRRHGGSVLV